MDSTVIASLTLLLYCASGVVGRKAVGTTGWQCNQPPNRPCEHVNDVCERSFCKVMVGKICAFEKKTECVTGGRCGVDSICHCISPQYYVNVTTPILCAASPTFIGGVCTGYDRADCRDPNSKCVNGRCRCEGEYFRDWEENKCIDGPVEDYDDSVSGLTVSVTLLLSGLFLTSHFL